MPVSFHRFLIILGLLTAAVAFVLIAGGRADLGVSAANPTVTTDKPDYSPNETVIITGSGFSPNAYYDVPVIRPDGTIVKGDGSFAPGWDTVLADASGSFVYLYQLDGITGTYTVQVYPLPWGGPGSGQTPVASTTFTDALSNLDQCQNGSLANLTTKCGTNGNNPPKWANGDVNSSNSQYQEGDGLPYRNSIIKLADGTWTIKVDYDFTKGGVFAIDRLTSYNLTQQSDPCGAGSAVTCTEGAFAFEFDMPGEVAAPDATHPALASGGALAIAGNGTLGAADKKMRVVPPHAPSPLCPQARISPASRQHPSMTTR